MKNQNQSIDFNFRLLTSGRCWDFELNFECEQKKNKKQESEKLKMALPQNVKQLAGSGMMPGTPGNREFTFSV